MTWRSGAEWYGQHGDLLFTKNIREPLGVTAVNAEIERSLVEAPQEFWYQNNGIIMLCEGLTPNTKIVPHGDIVIDAHRASVVNGAQTVAAIVAAVKRGGDVATRGLVGLRLIENSDRATGIRITKATNTQNHIEQRDFVALDSFQLELREEFALSLGLT